MGGWVGGWVGGLFIDGCLLRRKSSLIHMTQSSTHLLLLLLEGLANQGLLSLHCMTQSPTHPPTHPPTYLLLLLLEGLANQGLLGLHHVYLHLLGLRKGVGGHQGHLEIGWVGGWVGELWEASPSIFLLLSLPLPTHPPTHLALLGMHHQVIARAVRVPHTLHPAIGGLDLQVPAVSRVVSHFLY